MGTKFGTAIITSEDSFKAGREVAEKAMKKAGITKADLVIVFASSAYNYRSIVDGVRQVTGDASLIGCSTSGEFTEERVSKGSVACAVIASDTHSFFTGMGSGLRADEVKCLQDAAAGVPAPIKEFPYLSAMVMIDGIAGKGEESVLSALNALGPNVKFTGCAAGDDLQFRETVVFSNDKVASDSASIAFVASRIPVAIGVKHGHLPISPPLTVTKAKGNIVYEIDNKPAFEVWKEYCRESAKTIGINVDMMSRPELISSFFTRYEAGLLTGGSDYKIRWLGGTTASDGPITFPCMMAEGMVLRVMESPREAQILSARKAAENALAAARGVKLAGAIVFDCVCRAVILGPEFDRAVEGISEVLGHIPMIGFETYGEIAMELGQLSGFHNTTTVVLLIPE